jgi:ribokinase
MSVHICGSTVVDLIFPRVVRLPKTAAHTEFTASNLTLVETAPLVTIGGNGANAAYIAARCGAKVTLRSNVGRDALGAMALTWLTQAGCRVEPKAGAERTAVNVTAADTRMRRATLFYPGAAPTLPPRVNSLVSHALVCGWPHPPLAALARCLRAWKKRGVVTACDFGPILGVAPKLTKLRAVLADLDIFLANEHELLAITAVNAVKPALARLRPFYAGHIVIKLGPRGALWVPAGTTAPIHTAARLVKAINTVGAGDTFNGALLAALDRGRAFPVALFLAHAAAASVVSSPLGVLGLRTPRW